MILADWQLRNAVETERLKIEPFDMNQIQPASIDLRLDRHFTWHLRRATSLIDPAEEIGSYVEDRLPTGDRYLLGPGEFVLASTIECVTIPPNLCGMIKDKSSLARLGLGMLPAGFIDPGFSGHITLEIVNHAPRPFVLYPGMRIAQLVMFEMSSMPEELYGATGRSSRYQDQPRGPVTARTHIGWNVGTVPE